MNWYGAAGPLSLRDPSMLDTAAHWGKRVGRAVDALPAPAARPATGAVTPYVVLERCSERFKHVPNVPNIPNVRTFRTMAGYGQQRPALAGRGRPWPTTAGHGRPWPAIVGHGRTMFRTMFRTLFRTMLRPTMSVTMYEDNIVC